ncbi:MAG: hypothetical protein JNM88_13125 [Chitinophagaceae bacterium]|nr:hypothetical protein [Chitinophagaceae bacterium]
MDINHIELSAKVVADLYGSTLIDEKTSSVVQQAVAPPAETGPARTDKPDTAWKTLGNNQRNILVVVDNPGITYLADNELTFLTGVLGACKLTLADVAILNLHTHPGAGYKELVSHFNSKVVLLFAVNPADFGLPVSFPYYQLQPFAGCTFLYAPSLPDLENDRVEKSKLWVCLKRLFNL